MNSDTKIKSIQRTITQIQSEIRIKESQADLANISELEDAIQVLQTVLVHLSRPDVVFTEQLINPDVINSFSLDMRLRLSCVVDNVC